MSIASTPPDTEQAAASDQLMAALRASVRAAGLTPGTAFRRPTAPPTREDYEMWAAEDRAAERNAR